jgi:PPM family protein phosphatase
MARVTPSILTRGGIELAWGAATHVGKARQLNEDSYLAEPGAFLVADGMGGHQAGDVASRLTVEAVRELLSDEIPEISIIGDVVQRANETVRLHATESGREGMGSTLVGAFLVRNADEDSVVIVNVGDSRCYALIDAVLHQVTKDHSHVQELVDSGEITADTAASHPDRNVVTRAIGIEDAVAGDFFVVPPLRRVRLLLCSDGVSGELSDDRIAGVLIANEEPGAAASELIAAVLEGRAGDNATAIVIDLTRASLEPTVAPADVTGPRPGRDDDTSVTGPRPAPPAFRPPELIAEVPSVPPVHESTQVNEVIDDVPR